MKKLLTLAVSIAVISVSFSAFAKEKKFDQSQFKCVKNYYKNKSPKCIDTLVNAIEPASLQQKVIITHFLSAVFKDDAKMKERALAINIPENSKVLLMNALYMAGLKEEFIQYAVENRLEKQLKMISDSKIKKLNEIKPKDKAGDNDILFNAFLATGDVAYLKPVFANYKNLNKNELSDAIRVAVLISNFGPSMSPTEAKPNFVDNLCNKYKCKSKSSKIGHIMSIASAHWSILALAHEDDLAKNTFTQFLEGNKPIMEVITKENANLTNYITLVSITPIDDDKKMVETIIHDYENFKPIDTKNIKEIRLAKAEKSEKKNKKDKK